MSVFVFETEKGGVGKTTSTLNVAIALAKMITNGRVLVIDTDPQGNCATGLGVETNGRCLSQLLTGAAQPSQVVMKASSMTGGPVRDNVYLLPSSKALASTVTSLIEEIGAAKEAQARMPRVKMDIPTIDGIFLDAVGYLRDGFDYILIDSPPSLNPLRMAIHKFADYAIVPVNMDMLGFQATQNHTKTIGEDLENGGRTRIKVLLPTLVRPRLSLTRQVAQLLHEAYGRLVFTPGIPLATAVGQAPAAGGSTIIEYAPHTRAAKVYTNLARYLGETR